MMRKESDELARAARFVGFIECSLNFILCAIGVAFLGLFLGLYGCARVATIQHQSLIAKANVTCEYQTGRAGWAPWDPQQCLTICYDGGKSLEYLAGCSSEGGLVSGVKSALGVMPTVPVTP